MKNIKIITGTKPDLDRALELYAIIGWGDKEQYDTARYQTAFNNSKFILAYEDDFLVGMVRLTTDEAHETNVSEFLVVPEYQNQGIGKLMLEKLYDLYGHTDLYISTPKEHEDFFLRNGMQSQQLLQVSRRASR